MLQLLVMWALPAVLVSTKVRLLEPLKVMVALPAVAVPLKKLRRCN